MTRLKGKIEDKINIKIKGKIKGGGQECPPHTFGASDTLTGDYD